MNAPTLGMAPGTAYPADWRERYPFVCDHSDTQWWLAQVQGHWQLQHSQAMAPPLRLDFGAGAMAHRLRFRGSEAVARAVRAQRKPLVLDATAGLGRDAVVLAHLGCRVHAVEQNPALFLLLNEALKAVSSPITLHFGDARDYLNSARYHVVYLDPMYPTKRKSAAVKADMQTLHALLGEPASDNAEQTIALLEGARVAAPRIVLKRPKTAPVLLPKLRSGSISAGATRFDLYPGTPDSADSAPSDLQPPSGRLTPHR